MLTRRGPDIVFFAATGRSPLWGESFRNSLVFSPAPGCWYAKPSFRPGPNWNATGMLCLNGTGGNVKPGYACRKKLAATRLRHAASFFCQTRSTAQRASVSVRLTALPAGVQCANSPPHHDKKNGLPPSNGVQGCAVKACSAGLLKK